MAHHFHRSNQSPKSRQSDHEDLTDMFVAFTHLIGLKRFFSFTPETFDYDAYIEKVIENNESAKHPKDQS